MDTLEYGCSEAQGQPWSEDFLLAEELPDGLTSITLGEGQDNPVRLQVYTTELVAETGGQSYSGTIFLDLAGARHVVLNEADVFFGYGATTDTYESITGQIPMPFPGVELFEGFRFDPPASCEVGFAEGSATVLSPVHAPLDPTRSYLFVDCDAGFSGSIGSLEFSLPGGRRLIFVLDPFDPASYMQTNVDGLVVFGPSAMSRSALRPRS